MTLYVHVCDPSISPIICGFCMVQCGCQILANSRMQPAIRKALGGRRGHQIGDALPISAIVAQVSTKSVMSALTTHLRFARNGRHTILSTRLGFTCNGRRIRNNAHLRLLCNVRHDDGDARAAGLCSSFECVSALSFSRSVGWRHIDIDSVIDTAREICTHLIDLFLVEGNSEAVLTFGRNYPIANPCFEGDI
jgi:hypothetical protein